jgi:hypothetical protein
MIIAQRLSSWVSGAFISLGKTGSFVNFWHRNCRKFASRCPAARLFNFHVAKMAIIAAFALQ